MYISSWTSSPLSQPSRVGSVPPADDRPLSPQARRFSPSHLTTSLNALARSSLDDPDGHARDVIESLSLSPRCTTPLDHPITDGISNFRRSPSPIRNVSTIFLSPPISPLSPVISLSSSYAASNLDSPPSIPSLPPPNQSGPHSNRGMFHKANNFAIHNSVFQEVLYVQRCFNYAENSLSRCHPTTRRHVLETFHQASRAKKLLWLSGPAGVGKTAIMQSITESEVEWLVAKIFLSKESHDNDPRCLVQSIVDQLALHSVKYRQYVTTQIASDPSLMGKEAKEMFRKFFDESSAVWEGSESWLVLIDGFELCDGGERVQREIIKMIGDFAQRFPTSPFTWIIASRTEWWLKAAFSQFDSSSIFFGDHLEIDTPDAGRDVEAYFQDEFARIRSSFTHHFLEDQIWPSESEINALTKRAAGFFTYAVNASLFINDQKIGNPISQLSTLLKTPLLPLRDLYLQILGSVPVSTYTEVTKRILGCCKILPRNTFHSTSFLLSCNFLGINQNDAYASVQQLYSVLDVPSPANAAAKEIRIFHPTFSDFLQDQTESREYHISKHEAGIDIARCSFRILQEANKGADAFPEPANVSLAWARAPSNTRESLLTIAYDGFRLLPIVAKHGLSAQCLSVLSQADFSKLDCYCRPETKTEVHKIRKGYPILFEWLVEKWKTIGSTPEDLRQLVPVKEIAFRDVETQYIRGDRTVIYFQFTSGQDCYILRPKVYSDRPDIRERFRGECLESFNKILVARRRVSPNMKIQVWGRSTLKSCLLFEYRPTPKLMSYSEPVLKELFFIPYTCKASSASN